jgi:hypothetical protein
MSNTIPIDTAKIENIYNAVNSETEKISIYKNDNGDIYTVVTFSNQHIKNNQLKYIGKIEKNHKHLSRLYPSRLKLKNNVVGFVGTDLQDKRTLFFNFYADTLEIRKKGGMA